MPDALIAMDGPTSAFLTTRITAFYGRQFELRVSVSTISLQRIGIIYQVDAVLSIGDIVPLPENQASHINTFFHCYHFRFTH